MEFHFATIWESLADVLGDHTAVVHGDKRYTWAQYDERAARGVDLAQQRLQMRAHQGRIELQVLRDVGLQQAHFQFAAGSRETGRQHVRRGGRDCREAGDAATDAGDADDAS